MKEHIPAFVDYFSYESMTLDGMRTKLAELAENGVSQITLSSVMVTMLLEHPEQESRMLKLLREYGMRCRCAHGAWMDGEELSLPFEGDRKRMLERVGRTLEYAAEFGADTCALHAETFSNPTFPPRPISLWENYIVDGIERLLPLIEKLGICIALENIWGPLAMPDELVRIMKHFNSPYVGLCYDIGHAHVMSASGQKSCGWLPGIWKNYGGIIQWTDSALDDMLPYIVTSHLHDNYSDTDSHDMPGKGNVNWEDEIPKLLSAPKIRTLQSEVSTSFGYSDRDTRNAFKRILPSECF